MVTSDDSNRSPKEAVYVLNLIGVLSQNLPPSSDEFLQVATWVERLASEQSIGQYISGTFNSLN